MEIEATYKLKILKNQIGCYCSISFIIEEDANLRHHVFENHLFYKMNHSFYLSMLIGLNYALERIETNVFYKIKLIDLRTMVIDTTPMAVAYATSRAILQQFNHSETEAELKNIESKMFTTETYNFSGLLAFKNRHQEPRKTFFQKQQDILTWQPYEWHSDWIDNYAEFKILKTISLCLLQLFPNCDFHLNSFDVGYQLVEIYKNGEQWAEMQVADIDKETVFFDSLEFEEIYISLNLFS